MDLKIALWRYIAILTVFQSHLTHKTEMLKILQKLDLKL